MRDLELSRSYKVEKTNIEKNEYLNPYASIDVDLSEDDGVRISLDNLEKMAASFSYMDHNGKVPVVSITAFDTEKIMNISFGLDAFNKLREFFKELEQELIAIKH